MDKGILKSYGIVDSLSTEALSVAASKQTKKLVVHHLLHSLRNDVLAVFFHSKEGKGRAPDDPGAKIAPLARHTIWVQSSVPKSQSATAISIAGLK